MTTKTITTQVEDLIKDQEGPFTMYQLAGLASKLVGRYVREQQFYNYRRNGMIKGLVEGRLPKEATVEFLTKFVERQTK